MPGFFPDIGTYQTSFKDNEDYRHKHKKITTNLMIFFSFPQSHFLFLANFSAL